MERLTGAIQNYAWGSTSLLAELRGEEPSGEPEAEIWYGAHPGAATTLDDGTTLLERVEADAVGLLGHSIVDRFGNRLPFLLKLLAAGSPLSIQAHPSMEQAKAGFAAEDAAGIDRRAPNRSFKDDNHKPELICALTHFEALVGFRDSRATSRLFGSIEFVGLHERLASDGPKAVACELLDPTKWDEGEVDALVAELVEKCANYEGEEWAKESAMIGRLSAKYPGDPGIAVAALLNYTTLEPGEALYLSAGNMHAYLSGLGVEIMANSDNVLRGGLTPKHVDVANLLEVVVPDMIEPELVSIDSDGRYLTPAPEFALRRLDVQTTPEVKGPCIVLATEGIVTVTQGSDVLELGPTDAAWLGADERAVVSGVADQAWLASIG